jgi:aldose 1-epimerase
MTVNTDFEIKARPFGVFKGEEVILYTIENSQISCDIMNYGATVTSIRIPDKNGITRDIVLGFDNFDMYLTDHPCIGVTIGRYANRIKDGSFVIDGKTYTLTQNEKGNTLHSGENGFDVSVWELIRGNETSITLAHFDKDGNDGFPGNLTTVLTISVEENSIKFEYKAETDFPTHVSFTNHSYFNLNGEGSGTILDHIYSVNSTRYTEVDEELIPTGKLLDTKDSFYDLREQKSLRSKMQQFPGMDYDINYDLGNDGVLKKAATAYSETSGIMLELETTEPGLQFCSGSHIKPITGKSGVIYQKYNGFCVEPQHFPDSPNNPHFPSTLLRPNETYRHKTVLSFSTVNVL